MPDKVIEYLLLAEKYAKDSDNAMSLGEQRYNSLFLSHITWNPRNIITNWDGTIQEQMLYNLDDSCFDTLRSNEEFQKLQNRLKSSQSKK